MDLLVEVGKTLGLLAIPGSIVDMVVVGTRPGWDAGGFVSGLFLLGCALYLTGKIKGGSL